ncbi:MAG: sulfite exporter TauE/SafE family protein [Firmicutes bacterium]|nr:sulfite exporter TauE/SafE family protein [Bacillota bacterium]
MGMTGAVYFGVVLIACVIGSIVGLSGGIIVRPVLDAVGQHDIMNIAFFVSSSIVTMTIVSTYKKMKDGIQINLKVAAMISCGAVFGGMIGNLILDNLLAIMPNEAIVQLIQTGLTIFFVILAIYFTNSKLQYRIEKQWTYPIIGVILGTIAVFIGIGGGPINVPLFCILFGLSIKEATAYSIVIIFFSHTVNIITLAFTTGLGTFDVQYLLFILPAALIGGFIGSIISKKLSENAVKKAFLATMCGLILLNVYNGIGFFMQVI